MEQIYRSCCFTGHRPEKLPCGDNEFSPAAVLIKKCIRRMLLQKIQEGCDTFYCGMARGTDLWFAETLLSVMEEHPEKHLSLVPMIPHRGHIKEGSDYYARCQRVLGKAEQPRYFAEEFTLSSYHVRNRAMVDACAHLIAVFDGSKGGTKATYDYALSKHRKCLVYNPLSGSFSSWPEKLQK